MTTVSPAIVVEVNGPIAILRFANPQQRNPLSAATLKELQSALKELTEQLNLECFIFTGTADVFASGADIRELATLDRVNAQEFSSFGQEVFQAIAEAPQLTIAAINGYCMGGALDLELACDIRIASSNATFAHPGARLGIITGWGGTQRLPRTIGRAAALDMFLTARRIDAAGALRGGLVSRLVDDPVNAALAIFQETRHS
jgi:enoyl-CoA hydratase